MSKEYWDFLLGGFIVGFFVGLFFVAIVIVPDMVLDGYNEGQIDALSGTKVEFYLMEHPGGSKTWEPMSEDK